MMSRPLLRAGQRGRAVKALQLGLRRSLGAHAQNLANGAYGSRTIRDVERWKRGQGITPNGTVFGDTAWAALEKNLGVVAKALLALPARRTGLEGVTLDSRWRGTQSIFEQFVTPFLKPYGIHTGSQKRSWRNTASGNMSDHYVGATSSYAIDYPTYRGYAAARALAHKMGYFGWQPNSHAAFVVRIGGVSFRVQILWGSGINHGDHIHVGIKRI